MIIDASVALKWLVPEDGSDRALALAGRIDLMGPVLLYAEVANGLRKKTRRGELTGGPNLVRLVESLDGIVQTVDERSVMGKAVELAGLLDHSVYDCVYLALAEQLGQELVTADSKFLRKVEASPFAELARPL